MTSALGSQELRSLPRFKAYPAYKESGVEWLGEIPAHWYVKRLKYVAPMTDERSNALTSDLPYIGLEHIERGTARLLPVPDSASMGSEEAVGATSLFRPGDVLFGKLRPYLAKVLRPEFEGHCSTELLVLRSAGEITPSMLAYQLLSRDFIGWVDAMTYGAKMPRANPAQVLDISVALPPVHEQRAIAAFLDGETAKIDAIMAKQERLTELLQEKRISLINRVVIEGFDANPAKKMTGAALFPKIPEGWEMRKLRRLIHRVSRPVDVRPEVDYREIGIRSWGRGVFHKDPVKGAQLEEKTVFYIEPGDLVLNIVFAWEGAIAVASASEEGMVASHRFPTFRHDDDQADLDYLLMFFQSEYGRAFMGLNSPGAAGRNRTIRLSSFLAEEMPLPPPHVQRDIVRRFRAQEQVLAAAEGASQRLADGLLEHRSALISAAVTGKIDVRKVPMSRRSNSTGR